MGKFGGKKLLVLGTSVGSVDIVKYAKAEGAHVLVADYLPVEKSAAKQLADDTAMVSTLDVQALCDLVKQHHIDGVFCGVSEANIQSARKVCEISGLPTYYTDEQWNTFMNKDSFRELCRKYGVGVPTTYFTGSREQFDAVGSEGLCIEYPVIVKPVDNGANVGISVCLSRETLMEAMEFAFRNSDAGKAIVEQFVNGIEISPTYVVQNGRCELVCMGSKYAYENASGLKALSHAYIYPAPSPCLDEYLQDVDSHVKDMVLSQGINNCTIFFQGIYSDHKFYIFEAGLRMEGTATFRITKRMGGNSFMEFMTDNALGVQSDYDISREDVTFGGRKCVIFSMISTGGIIGRVEGFEEAAAHPMVVASEQRHQVGEHVANDGTLRQIMFRFVLQDDDLDNVLDTIRFIQNTVKAYDQEGNYMLITGFDPEMMR